MKSFAQQLKVEEQENAALKRLIALREENAALRLSLGVCQSQSEALQRILALVCAEFNVSPATLISRGRMAHVVLPRQIAYLLLREYTTLTTTQIGTYFERDHGTVIYGAQAVLERLGQDRNGLNGQVQHLRAKVEDVLKLNRAA